FSHHDLKNLSQLELNSFELQSNGFNNRPKDQDQKEGHGQKVIPIKSSVDFSQIDTEIASEVYKDIRTGKYELPQILITLLSEEIKSTYSFRSDFDLKEVEALYLQYQDLIDNDYSDHHDFLSEGEFASTVMALYRNGKRVKSSFKKQLEAWFNNKFDFKKEDKFEELKKRNELEGLPY
ncbi:hypothetical protein COJ96_10635, partial [Bacillus sp. AFS073361]|uniref:hypothetical protein n=1 Tax=Bacillus sp. AFS073361 TaxID=2033511 RepID=UPI000C0160BC